MNRRKASRRWIEPLDFLTGCALPGKVWDGWTVHGDRLYAPNGRWFDANLLEQVERVYAMARLWRQDAARRHPPLISVVLPFPEVNHGQKGAERSSEAPRPFPAAAQIGGVR